MSKEERGRSSLYSRFGVREDTRPDFLPPKRKYIFLGSPPRGKFGFGSYAPSRPGLSVNDFPGPGEYKQSAEFTKTMSIRGTTPGFTTFKKRELEFTKGTMNPGPDRYNPTRPSTRLAPGIGKRFGGFLNSTDTPGPGSYNLPQTRVDTRPTYQFRSKVPRKFLDETPPQQPIFDGRTLYIETRHG